MSNKPIKVLTEEGLRVLWNQISLDDYPNNDLLIAVLDGIDATKADKTEVADAKEEVLERLEAVAAAGADWNQNNSEAIDYVKNRTHWVESSQAVEVINCQLRMSGTFGGVSNSLNQMDFNEPLIIGESYQAVLNGITYTNLTPVNDEDRGVILHIFDTGTSSAYLVENTQTLYVKKYDLTTSNVFQVMRGSSENVYHTLDENFIPETIARKSDLQNIDLSSLETKSDAASKLQEAKDYSDANLEVAQAYTDQQIAAIPTPDVSGQISTHNTSTESHNDIRLALSSLSTQVNNFLDVDDTTKDQLSEVLAMIEANEGTLESLTTSKVNKSDIVNNLTTNDAEKVLSGAQGVVIQDQIDDLNEAKLNKSDAANMYASKSAFLLHEGNTDIHFTAAERTKLENIEAGAQVNTITGVKGNSESTYRTGNVNITKANIGLENVDNTADSEKPVSTAQQTAINTAKAAANTYTDGKIATEVEARDAAISAAKAQAITEGANSAVNTINTKLTNDYYDKEQIDNYVLITVSEIDTIWGYDPATAFKDFNYTTNDNDTYTLTEWKGTTDGVESTECIIPDDPRIIL